ncbi:MAG: TIGR02996 domain-containing protein [Planctomycetes bacterium]|nr:TIGR02996 domain-containing protein [Planctomycetota bacterium]
MLATVTADLSDPIPKSIYADWLDDRGDPRGRFLREFLHFAKQSNDELPPSDEFPIPWRHAVVENRIVFVHSPNRVTLKIRDSGMPPAMTAAKPVTRTLAFGTISISVSVSKPVYLWTMISAECSPISNRTSTEDRQ